MVFGGLEGGAHDGYRNRLIAEAKSNKRFSAGLKARVPVRGDLFMVVTFYDA